MARETLLTAARRVMRFLNIDLNKGGLIQEETEKSLITLDRMINEYKNGASGTCPNCGCGIVILMEDPPEH